MNRRLRFVVPVLALVLALPALHADIGEDFAKGGIGFSGGGSVFLDFGQLLNSADTYFRWSLTLEPSVDYYVADRLSLFLAPWFTYDSETLDADNVDNTVTYGAEAGLSYAFVSRPDAQRGLVPAIGVGLAAAVYPGGWGKFLGSDYDNQSLNLYLLLGVPFRLFFFLNDRVAPYVGLRPRVWYLVSARDSSGTTLSPPSQERLYVDLSVTLGVSFHVPTRNATMLGSR